ncbi:hypothetical protein N7492_002494 [Penicillium capsulatum]|uniref:Uncharacterized protein n=1 Tax=Penicillium capsulatum TaxID=69766 RepID=A0A9W9IK58_9EURO|nr:hypothetical protein N7492_002494 [Penicillium capsulatum]KAJ6122902.1 hypothetical protein N7512_005367 [Penicillium capsulatum]
MTTFSLVALPLALLLLAVRYYGPIRQYISSAILGKDNGNGPADLKRMAPYPAQPIKGRERYRVMMDIRKLDAQNWLTLDKNYMEEHRVRDHLLREQKDKVLQCLPESADACQEALEEVSEFLCERFPNMFAKAVHAKQEVVENRMTGERFNVAEIARTKNLPDALEAAVRLTMEDLSVLMKNEDDEYYLYDFLVLVAKRASASLFPTGWTVQERIGWTISRLHEPVPLWHQHVANSVSKFLARLTPTSPMERSNYFVEVKRPDEDLFEILYRPGVLCEKDLSNPSPEEIIIRRERQTFRRLPRTGAIVFGVKTYLTPINQLPMQELENLAKEMQSWPEYVGEYKGKDVWGAKVLEFYRNRAQMNEKADV